MRRRSRPSEARTISSSLLLNFSLLLSSFFSPAILPAQPRTLLVAAASDLGPLEKQLSNSYETTYKRKTRFVLGSSGQLAAQIRQGAPYDVYLSANKEFVQDLEKSGHLLRGSVRLYATGRLAIWSKSLPLKEIVDLVQPSITHVAIANPNHAPYGLAAKQALESAGLWESLQPRLVLGENVRQVLQFAESGNVQAALVAWSLVIGKGGVLVPESLHPPIRQAAGIVSSTRKSAEANQFLEMLCGKQTQQWLARNGFQTGSCGSGSPNQPETR
ncbi:MAG: molybdate ABC transporter substrate-binding protein [Acidimicrobiia bacterium]|nr:molybdate ABC transporter substrate-binding protein [Acidimicrobiia bacterium]